MGGKGSGGHPNSRRPIKDPVALARALELVDGGMLASEVAEHPEIKGKVGQRTIYDAIDRRNGKKAPPRKRVTRVRRPVPEVEPKPEQPAPIEAEKPPVGTPAQTRLWYVEQQIATVRRSLAIVQAKVDTGDNGALARVGNLNEQLRKWLEVHAELQPADPVDPEEEQKKHRQAADAVIVKIKAGIARHAA